MSQTSAVGRDSDAKETLVPLRWVVLFTGSKATEDYEPAASEGEDPQLVKEVTAMAVAFHPHSEIRLFPSERGVLLFWKAQTTGDWIVTDIALAPNPMGVRTALEYVSFLLKEGDLARLRFDPFEVTRRGLHDKLREHFLAGRREPIPASLPRPVARKAAVDGVGRSDGNAVALPDANRVASLPNARALEAFCASGLSTPPPTFATWWAANGTPPEGAFEIVLRAEAPKSLTLRDAVEESVALAAELKSALPETASEDTVSGEMARAILSGADTISTEVSTAASRLNDESPDRFRERLSEATSAANRLIGDLGAYRQRLGAAAAAHATVLDMLGERYATLARHLALVRHPNPFAAPKSTGTNSAARNGSGGGKSEVFPRGGSVASGGGGGAKAAAAVAVAVAVLGGGAYFLTHRNTGGGSGQKQPTAKHNPATPKGKPAPTPPTTSDMAALQRYQSDAIPFARTRAHDVAHDLAERLSGASGAALDESRIDKIAVGASQQAYKKLLSEEDYREAFARDSWNYARLKKTLPDLAAAAHESAMLGATEGRMAAMNAARPAATPEPSAPPATPRSRRETPEPTPTPKATRRPTPEPEKATPRPSPPRPATPKPATPKPPPHEGTADQNNL